MQLQIGRQQALAFVQRNVEVICAVNCDNTLANHLPAGKGMRLGCFLQGEVQFHCAENRTEPRPIFSLSTLSIGPQKRLLCQIRALCGSTVQHQITRCEHAPGQVVGRTRLCEYLDESSYCSQHVTASRSNPRIHNPQAGLDKSIAAISALHPGSLNGAPGAVEIACLRGHDGDERQCAHSGRGFALAMRLNSQFIRHGLCGTQPQQTFPYTLEQKI